MARTAPGRYQGKDPATGRKMLDGITAIVSERTGEVTYQARWHWYDATDQRRQKTVTRKVMEEAEALLLQAELEIRKGIYAPDEAQRVSLTMNAYVDRWIKRESMNWAPSTILMRRNAWRIAFRDTIGEVQVTKLTRPMCQREVERLVSLTRGTYGDDAETPRYRPRTIHAYVRLLKQVLNAAVDDEIIAVNPVRRLTVPRIGTGRQQAWSADTTRTFLDRCTRSECCALWWFLATTGARIGEALAIRWSDLDLTRGTVTFRRTLQRQTDGTWGVKEGTKATSEPETIPLVPSVIDRLSAMRKEMLARPVVAIDPYVFRPAGKERWSQATVRNRLKRDCRRAKLPEISPHTFRHTAGTLLVSLGVPESMVRVVLRHKSIITTLGTYVHPNQDDLREAVGRLDTALNATTSPPKKEENAEAV